jgi:hypothetical protein
MGAADDIKKGLTKNLANFTKQRKAEERQSGAGRWRYSRMTEARGIFIKEAFEEVIVECYTLVSDNNTLPAHVRQIFYKARPPIEQRTDKPLAYAYFSQTLLPDYINERDLDWDVVYDDRGHFVEPHTGRQIGLGTLSVRDYLGRVGDMDVESADFNPAKIKTYGPDGAFGALLYIEKEGFMPLLKRVKLAKRRDLAIMSSKGMSVIAARQLAEGICSKYGIPLLVLHDFDRPGVIIRDTLENDTRRFSYARPPKVIDLGLTFDDIDGLVSEPHDSKISDERLRMAGLDLRSIDFLRENRVELNAMTSRQLVEFIERKLDQHGIGKVIPGADVLAGTYELFAKSDRLFKAFEDLQEELEDEDAEPVEIPEGLDAKVEKLLKEKPEISWHRAVRLIVDPDLTDDEDDDDDEEEEDLSDIEE